MKRQRHATALSLPNLCQCRACQQATLIGCNQFCWVSGLMAFECGSCHPQEGALEVCGDFLGLTVFGMSSGLQRDARYPTMHGTVSQERAVPALLDLLLT